MGGGGGDSKIFGLILSSCLIENIWASYSNPKEWPVYLPLDILSVKY